MASIACLMINVLNVTWLARVHRLFYMFLAICFVYFSPSALYTSAAVGTGSTSNSPL